MSNGLEVQGSIDISSILRAFKELAQKAKETGTDIKTLFNTDKEAQNLISQLKTFQTELATNIPAATNASVQSVGKMNMAIGQLGYLVGDADMFFMNFRMGMMSIANNFPMVVQYMQYARQEAQMLNMTFGQALVQSLTGPGGLLLAVNAAMFMMNALARTTSNTKNEVIDLSLAQLDSITNTDKLSDALKKLNDELNKLTVEELIESLRKANLEVFQLHSEFEQLVKQQMFVQALGGAIDFEDFIKRYADAVARLAAIQNKLKEGSGIVNRLRADIAAITKLRDESENETEITNYNVQLKTMQERLNQLTGKEREHNKELALKKSIIDKIIDLELKRVGLISDDFIIDVLPDINLKKISGLEGVQGMLNPSKQIRITGPGIDNLFDPMLKVHKMVSQTSAETQILGKVFSNTGHIMTNAFMSAIQRGKQLSEIIKDIGLNALNMGLSMGMQGFFGGLFGLLTGGGFMPGFLGALGINPRAQGGIIDEPVVGVGLNSKSLWTFGEKGNEWVTPMDKMRVPNSHGPNSGSIIFPNEIEFKVRGKDLSAVVRRIEKLEKRYGKTK